MISEDSLLCLKRRLESRRHSSFGVQCSCIRIRGNLLRLERDVLYLRLTDRFVVATSAVSEQFMADSFFTHAKPRFLLLRMVAFQIICRIIRIVDGLGKARRVTPIMDLILCEHQTASS